MKEKSLIFIKPWSISQAEEIFEFLDNFLNQKKIKFKKTKPVLIKKVLGDKIRKHYSEISHLPKFENLISDFANGSILLSVYTGEDIIRNIREIIGSTDPSKAEKNTIRAKFSDDSIESSDRENRGVRNVIHSSSSTKDAEREIEIWKEFLKSS